MEMNKAEAIEYANKLNAAIDSCNLGYEQILGILHSHNKEQAVFHDAVSLILKGKLSLSDSCCPKCGCDVSVILAVEKDKDPRLHLSYSYGGWLVWGKRLAMWAVECDGCGLRTSNNITLEGALEQWKKFNDLK